MIKMVLSSDYFSPARTDVGALVGQKQVGVYCILLTRNLRLNTQENGVIDHSGSHPELPNALLESRLPFIYATCPTSGANQGLSAGILHGLRIIAPQTG